MATHSIAVSDLNAHSQTTEQADFVAIVDAILLDIEKLCQPLLQALEIRFPNHRYGQQKQQHMHELSQKAAYIARSQGLSEIEAELSRIVFRAHDIGRHIEILCQLDLRRVVHRHGFLSADFLEEHATLEKLPLDFQSAILDAIRYHSEREVPLQTNSMGWRLCYLLRDADKLEILNDKQYASPAMIVSELELGNFPFELDVRTLQQLAENQETRTHLEFTTAQLLIPTAAYHLTDQQESLAERAVTNFMTAALSQNVIDTFCHGQQLPVSEAYKNYSTFLLAHIALIFDFGFTASVEETQEEKLLDGRLTLLQQRIPNCIFQRICQALKQHAGYEFEREEFYC